MRSIINNFLSEVTKKTDSLIDSVKAIDFDINFDNLNDEMSKLTSTLQSKFSKVMANAKTLKEKHIIEIPYDNETSTFSFKIDGHALDVGVSSNDGVNRSGHMFTIPDDVDVTNVNQTYDPVRKVLIFKFGKKIAQ